MTTNVDAPAEQTAPSNPGGSPSRRSGLSRIFNARVAEASLLPFAFVLVIAGFGIARPDTFFQWSNFTSIFGLNAPTLVLVMALLIPLTNGDLDLSVAELFGMIAILVGWLNVNQHWGDRAGDHRRRSSSEPLCRGHHRLDSSSASTSTRSSSRWRWAASSTASPSGCPTSSRFRGSRPKLTDWTVLHHILGIPLDFWYGIVIMLIMFYVLTFTPFGQRSLFVGQSREVARLSGFKVNSTRFWAFVVGGFIAAIGGVLNDGVLGTATPQNQGPLLLSVYAAAFLGMTTIQPGRFNAIGAGISVFFLAVAVNGMNLLGAQTYVQ